MPTVVRLILLLALCLAARPAAALHIVDPWPEPADVTGVRTETVSLRSSDPFIPADIGRAKPREVTAQLFLPPGASTGHPVPAVILLHGSAGNAWERGERYGPPLAAMGMAVMMIDTYASRPDLGASFIARVPAWRTPC